MMVILNFKMPESSLEIYTDKNLQAFIEGKGIAAKLIHLAQATPTVPDAARALGVETTQIVKSLVFLVEDKPILVIAAGEVRISQKLLARVFEVGKRKLKFARPEQALDITGFEVGAMPPFGHKHKLPTVIDLHSLNQSVVYGGGGTKSTMLELTVDTLKQVTEARLELLTEREEK